MVDAEEAAADLLSSPGERSALSRTIQFVATL